MRLTAPGCVALAFAGICLGQTVGWTQVQAPVEPGPGVTNPVLTRSVPPRFPDGGLARKIQGVVEIEVVIKTDGTVGEAQVVDSLDGGSYGFDQEALRAARAFRFQPALKDGYPVPVKAVVQIEFRQHDESSTAPGVASYGDIAARLRKGMPVDAAPPRQAQKPVEPGPGVTPPTATLQATPQYSESALRQKLEGHVEVEMAVLDDGSVGAARIHTSPDPASELNVLALQTARRWRFAPGQVAGKPVPFKMILGVDFRLGPWSDEEFYRDVQREGTAGLVIPKPKAPARPSYSSDAMRRKVQGAVEIEAVVAPDGVVSRARVTKSLDPRGLDDEALIAARLSTFEPGTLNGKPVPVLVKMQFEFRVDR